jgi:hypothetical protein
MDIEFLVRIIYEEPLGVDSGNSYTTLEMYLMTLNYILMTD